MTTEDFSIPISMFTSKDDNQPAHKVLDWSRFVRGMCRHRERENKDGPAFSPVTYREGTTRGKANVEAVHALVLDIDHAGEPPWDLLERWEYVGHTTFQHTPAAPRWRVVIPLSRPVSGTDWPGVWLRANAYFANCLDPSTKDSSRIFFFPSCPPGAEHLVRQQHAALLDPDELPEVPVYAPPPRINNTAVRSYLGSWAARFTQAKCDQLALMPRESGRNSACNRIAHLLAGLVADPSHNLGEDVVREGLLEACARNGLIAEDGERSVLATIESGFESGIMRPWSPADQDQLLGTRKYQRSYEEPQVVDIRELRLDIVRMSDVVVEPIHWLWRGRLARGKLTLLMGDPGLGKSLITHWLGALVSTGGQWPDGGECERSAAIVFTLEDALADTVKPRLIAAGANMNRVIAVRGVVDQKASLDARMFALEEHVALLEQLVVEEGASLIVMDPVSSYLGANVNTHKETDVRRVLSMLGQMAERTGVAVLMVIHLNKGKDVAALNRATGSIAFPAVSRIVLGVVPDPLDEDGKRRLLLPLKCNVARMPAGLGYRIESAPNEVLLPTVDEQDRPPILVWDDEPVLDDMSLALDRGSVQERTATEEAVQVLVEIYANTGYEKILSTEMNRQLRDAGVSTSGSVLTAAKSQLGIKSRQPGGFGTPWYWMPPTKKLPSRARADARASHPTESESVAKHEVSGGTSRISSQVPPDTASFRPDSPRFPDSERILKFCPRCKQHMDAEVYPSHMPCADMTGLPEGLCPIHRYRFDMHDCDAL